jgi:hypothetical protein
MTEAPGPPDDATILGTSTLLRRITPDWIVPDNAGGTKLSRQAFQDQTADNGIRAMSVFIQERLNELEIPLLELVADHARYGVVGFLAEVARGCNLGVTWAPTPADGPRGAAHAHVICRKTGSVQARLVAASVRLIEPG